MTNRIIKEKSQPTKLGVKLHVRLIIENEPHIVHMAYENDERNIHDKKKHPHD